MPDSEAVPASPPTRRLANPRRTTLAAVRSHQERRDADARRDHPDDGPRRDL